MSAVPQGPAGGPVCRILHVVSGLDRGGIEIWLLHVLKRIDRRRYQMDFLIVGPQPGTKAEAFERLGARIILCRTARRPWRFARDFHAALRRFGPYDAIHAHVHHYDGFVLWLAAKSRVPIRIAHSHNDTRPAEVGVAPWRRLYLALMRHAIQRYATHCLAVSRSAGEDLFGHCWPRDPRAALVTCGLDFTPFAARHDRTLVRTALGLPADALVLGHVGWFQWRKNHDFLIEIAAAVFAREPRSHLLLVGDGERKGVIEARVAALGMADRVVFAGGRDDIPALMQCMDAFVFPSHHEGLGLVLLEAQAAGLPCMISSTMPEEIDVVPALIHRLPLRAPPELWAACILEAVGAARPSPEEALRAVCASEFEIDKSARRLQQLYDGER